jgi:predicted negative regulator of RcsB-dependent stress response
MQDVHEQHELEALKRWWKENGMAVITGGLLALAGVLGWQGYQDYQRANHEAASIVYESLRAGAAGTDFAKVSREARQLMVDHESSPYAVGAALLLAKHEVEKADWEGAQSDLKWVMTHASEAHWRSIAAIRLARVLIEVQKTADALAVLNTASKDMSPAFKGMADYVRGMALMQQGDQGAAQAAFKSAQANPELASSLRSLSQLWVDDLVQVAQ